MNYTELPGLDGVYLEESYVLEICTGADALVFRLDAVLTPMNPAYRPPPPGDRYCYRHARLIFDSPAEVDWISRHAVTSFDATGEADLGTIDTMEVSGGRARLEGEWGSVEVALSRPPRLLLEDEPARRPAPCGSHLRRVGRVRAGERGVGDDVLAGGGPGDTVDGR